MGSILYGHEPISGVNDLKALQMHTQAKIKSAFFITFSGDCKKALSLYQSCFGGKLYFDTFEETLAVMEESPVISGSLISDKMTMYGSDLVHNEGRRVGNFISIYIHCNDSDERCFYLKKLDKNQDDYAELRSQKLIEITDAFDVRWVFGI